MPRTAVKLTRPYYQ